MLADRDAEGPIVYSRILPSTTPAAPVVFPSNARAASLMESSVHQTLTALLEKKYYGTTRLGVLASIAYTLGGGYEWHRGHLRNLTGHQRDKPWITVPTTDTAISLPIPQACGTIGDLYPQSSAYHLPNLAPETADPYWLAALLVLLETSLTQPITLLTGEDRIDQQHTILLEGKATLLNIVAHQGLDDSPWFCALLNEIADYLSS